MQIKPPVKNPLDITGMEVRSKPMYLSPSSLSMFEKQPCSFFLERMVENPKPREAQSLAAAAGSAFDFETKIFLLESGMLPSEITAKVLFDRAYSALWNKEDKERYKDSTLHELMWESSIEIHNREAVRNVGKALLDVYKHQVQKFKFFDIDCRIKYNLKILLGGEKVSVPLYGIVDCVIEDPMIENSYIPMDLKVSGFASASNTSPKPKYYMRYYASGKVGEAHEDYWFGIPMDKIDIDWATQCCTYGWMLGYKVGKPFSACIHLLICNENDIQVVLYHGVITPEFQMTVIKRYVNCWIHVQNPVERMLGKLIPDDRLLCEIKADSETWYGGFR